MLVMQGTFWVAENGDCEDVPPLDFASLEQLFAQAAPKTAAAAKASASAGAPAAAAKPKQVSLIDGKRGHNVSILMGGKIKIPPAELRAAVLKLDPRAVGNEESVAALMQCIPSADEAAALEAYTRSGKPASDLADPDRVLLEMHSIPYVEARLRCYAHKFAAPHKLHSASQVCVGTASQV
ncbi:hypothetical protein DUNSADRAFT_2111 [Dunaliella salina]|uniref:FH2 domain-containing protein n=1 Tax=Dunaliella salina TaxID=3046 RepID=A0ABQ7GW60_DUNSA|nr:hypothetical protein DUNSADRAFT_2111 [Dunaliella salina]|eukprot:KAF5838853.1 hypothetical protein DUNSADRAFT_2111 [Dunaliella salina]